jgi:hypothetical protein
MTFPLFPLFRCFREVSAGEIKSAAPFPRRWAQDRYSLGGSCLQEISLAPSELRSSQKGG